MPDRTGGLTMCERAPLRYNHPLPIHPELTGVMVSEATWEDPK